MNRVPQAAYAALLAAIPAWSADARAGEPPVPEPSATQEPRAEDATPSPSARPEERGWAFELALASGYATPVGLASADGQGIRSIGTSFIPIELDWSMFSLRGIAIGGYYRELLPVGPSTATSLVAFQFGAYVDVRLAPASPVEPWIRIANGLELVRARDVGAPGVNISCSGSELVRGEFSLRFRDSPLFGFSPYVGASLGPYTDVTRRSGDPAEGTSQTIHGVVYHGWLTAGFRGTWFIAR